MKAEKIVSVSTILYMSFSAFAIVMVSVMALRDPQAVMDLVQVKLPNTDAYSSIRGIYGGVGFLIFILFVYLMVTDHLKGLIFTALLWGFYALSRLITIFKEGALGDFGNQWLTIESILFFIALILLSFKLRMNGLKKV